MQQRHLATAALLLSLALGACGEGGREPKPATAPPTEPAAAARPAAPSTSPPAPPVTVRTDDLDAELRTVDEELTRVQQSVNHANEPSTEADG